MVLNLIKKTGIYGIIIALIVLLFSLGSLVGLNEAGYRTVIQFPNGTMKVQFDPGYYLKWFGQTTEYDDVLTFNFDKNTAETKGAIDQVGVEVRYQDGGTGEVLGQARYALPYDQETMIKLHKAFKTNTGVAYKLIKSVTEEGMNLTAGLMTSEEAYATNRTIFTDWAKDQIGHGKYKTELVDIEVIDEAGKTVITTVPQIKINEETGYALQHISDLEAYGVEITGFQITDWDFEEKTLAQIAAKREATMAIITAKAEAERAKQEAITAEEQGKKNVMTAKYEKEVEKQKAVVEAEQAKEVAVIKATQLVDVAAQQKLEAEQKKLTAVEYKAEQILRGEGDAEYKRLVIEADGALEQKLQTYENVMTVYAQEFGKQKWTPEIMMGGSGDMSGGNEAANLINLLIATSLKDLGLDMGIQE